MDLDKAIKERHSVRSFKKTKQADYKKIIDAMLAALKAPLAGNHPSVKLILVTDKEKIKQLAEASQQGFVDDVDNLVVFCTDKKYLEKSYGERGKMYARQQAGAAIENFLLKLTDSGLASCWVGAFSDEAVRRILKVPDNIDIEAFFPVGYELGKAKQLDKPDLDMCVFFDTFGNRFMKPRKIQDSSKV
jgi:nitroreductase